MTAYEVFNEITSEPKWYSGYTTAQNASNIKRKFLNGRLSYETLVKMFNHYGYDLTPGSWSKNR